MLDLFAGRLGWSKAFLARGWEVVAVDLVRPSIDIPKNCTFIEKDVLRVNEVFIKGYDIDFICASSPCEEFSVHCMKHFHPHPKYPEFGITLFNHTRAICEKSGIPYIMENVRCAEQWVGNAKHHCGPFFLWGNAVPPLVNQGIKKGWEEKWIDSNGNIRDAGPGRAPQGKKITGNPGENRRDGIARAATIPPELAACVAEYAERLLEMKSMTAVGVEI